MTSPTKPAAPSPRPAESYVPTEEQCREAAEARGEVYRPAPSPRQDPEPGPTMCKCRRNFLEAGEAAWLEQDGSIHKRDECRPRPSPLPSREEVTRAILDYAEACMALATSEGDGEEAADRNVTEARAALLSLVFGDDR